VGERVGDSEWPLGREITPLAVKGWLRRVEGVSRVVALTLSGNGATNRNGSIDLGPIGLPLLAVDDEDIEVRRSPAGSRR
jgi:hypothetical protein